MTIDLEPLIWAALQDIAAQQARSVGDLVMELAREGLYAAIHVYVAEFYNADAAPDDDPGS